MKVVFSQNALEEIREIAAFIAEDHPAAARRWRRNLKLQIGQLEVWPLSGRVVPELEEENVREVIVGNYRAIYRVKTDVVEVLRVLDARREFPTTVGERVATYGAAA